MKYKQHDIVKHKTGTQEMVVLDKKIPYLMRKTESDELVLCQWFDGSKLMEEEFHEADLQLVSSYNNT